MVIPKEYSLKRALQEGINLFLGAGFSLGAIDSSGKPFPLGADLVGELNKEFNTDIKLPLANLCTILKAKDSRKLNEYLTSRFKVSSTSPEYSYDSLNNINIKNIFSVNIDNLIMYIFRNNRNRYINDVTSGNGISNDSNNAINYIALHGCVTAKNKYTFTTFDLNCSFQDKGLWHIFMTALAAYPTLFIGYGFNDNGTIESLAYSSQSDVEIKEMWATVHPSNRSFADYLSAIHVNPIVTDTQEILGWLSSFSGQQIDSSQMYNSLSEECYKRLSKYTIRKNDEAVRSVKYFFLGDPPLWYDIQSNLIAKTHYYGELYNLIDSGSDIILSGIAGSGKTTLLMQVADGYKTNKIKLICNSPSKEEAEFILNNLDGAKAIIFCDHFASDMESFNIFVNASNIQLIAADREHFINIVGHLINDNRIEELNITKLSSEDQEIIRKKIPVDLFSQDSKLQENENISIYEFIEGNINKPLLKDRYIYVLKEIDKIDSRMCDILLLISYVYSCRSPASYTMLYTFLGRRIVNYQELFILINQLNSLVKDAYTQIEHNEDFFRPRSTLIAEAIISACKPSRLAKFLNDFFEILSPTLIHRFDIFRKQAFDAKTIGRAFSQVDEGIEFYNKMLKYDDSPYIKQQFAIYLMHKNKFTMAFNMIDRAIGETGGKNFSIRNTHAIILFKANINKDPNDMNVINSIAESMDILSKCYLSDKRKLYHVKVYSEHALQFREVYGDEKAREYISKAISWIELYLETPKYDHNLKRLYNKLRKNFIE